MAHEDRRSLRGMGIFAAWIDRVDAKAGNTLDTLVTVGDITEVHHHPLDFGSTLGSGGVAPNEWWEGHEYLYAGKPLVKKLFGFGLPLESWRTIDYPNLRGVGRIEADHFDPDAWRSRVPNAAYIRADADDTFWAARKLLAMTDDLIVAAVRSGKYSDKAAENYLIRTLIKRRDVILRRYLPSINPIVDLALDRDGTLTFQNAAVMADVSTAPASYRATWYTFDNLNGTRLPIATTESRAPIMNGPTSLIREVDSFVRIDVEATSADHPSWSVPVSGYFRRTDNGWTLVGLDRAGGNE